MRIFIAIQDDLENTLLDKVVYLEQVKKYKKKDLSYELPDKFSLTALIDEAIHIELDRKLTTKVAKY